MGRHGTAGQPFAGRPILYLRSPGSVRISTDLAGKVSPLESLSQLRCAQSWLNTGRAAFSHPITAVAARSVSGRRTGGFPETFSCRPVHDALPPPTGDKPGRGLPFRSGLQSVRFHDRLARTSSCELCDVASAAALLCRENLSSRRRPKKRTCPTGQSYGQGLALRWLSVPCFWEATRLPRSTLPSAS